MKAKSKDACLDGSQEALTPEAKTKRIRVFNDSLRKHGWGGKVLVTNGIMAQGTEFAGAVLKAVQEFDSFSDENDPWGEHDCSSLVVMHKRILWKIDYYDKDGVYLSPDPSSSKLTLRVLTIMLSAEY
jgi:hypothetical protein